MILAKLICRVSGLNMKFANSTNPNGKGVIKVLGSDRNVELPNLANSIGEEALRNGEIPTNKVIILQIEDSNIPGAFIHTYLPFSDKFIETKMEEWVDNSGNFEASDASLGLKENRISALVSAPTKIKLTLAEWTKERDKARELAKTDSKAMANFATSYERPVA